MTPIEQANIRCCCLFLSLEGDVAVLILMAAVLEVYGFTSLPCLVHLFT